MKLFNHLAKDLRKRGEAEKRVKVEEVAGEGGRKREMGIENM